MSTEHPKDLSKTLANLVENGFLASRGATRATVYFFADKTPDANDDGLVSSQPASAQQIAPSSQHLPSSSQHLSEGSQHLTDLAEHWSALMELARPVRDKGKSPRQTVQDTILKLCEKRFLTVRNMSDLLGRDSNSLLNHYLKSMVEQGALELKFADKTHPQQAYRTKTSAAS